MVAADMTCRHGGSSRRYLRHLSRRRAGGDLLIALLVAWLLTAAAVLTARLDPALAPGRAPHPALRGTLADAGSILANNLRVLAGPFALVLLGFHRSRASRALGDLVVVGLVAINTVGVGLVLGRDGTRLLPYIPQLPIEWLALALSASAWIAARRDARPRSLRVRAGQSLLVAAVAAAVETLLTPHAR